MDWDDLRHFIELVRAGTLSGAAHRLGVTHTTISRRLRRLEERMGEPLFTRSPQGYALTERGQTLWTEAQRIEGSFSRITRQLPQNTAGLSGLVRIGCTEGFGTRIIAPLMVDLNARFPALHLDLIIQPRPILLARNEADILITIDRPERGPYVIKRLTDYTLHLYAAQDYLAQNAPITSTDDLTAHRLISYVAEHSPARDLPMMTELTDIAATDRSTSIVAQQMMVRSGAGIAVLPDFVAGSELVRVLDDVVFHRSFWMIIPSSLHKSARVRAVSEAIAEIIRKQRATLMRH